MSDHTPNSFTEQQASTNEVTLDLQDILSVASTDPKEISGVVIGKLVGQSESGGPLVDFAANLSGQPVPAESIAKTQPEDVGRDAALMFLGGDPRRPILMGLIHVPTDNEQTISESATSTHDEIPVGIEADNERIEIKADREIVLRCGKASITLTRAGKVLIRGAYLLSRSSGANRIKGGSIQLN